MMNRLLSRKRKWNHGPFALVVKIKMRTRELKRWIGRELCLSLSCLSKKMVGAILRTPSVARTSLKLVQLGKTSSYET